MNRFVNPTEQYQNIVRMLSKIRNSILPVIVKICTNVQMSYMYGHHKNSAGVSSNLMYRYFNIVSYKYMCSKRSMFNISVSQ